MLGFCTVLQTGCQSVNHAIACSEIRAQQVQTNARKEAGHRVLCVEVEVTQVVWWQELRSPQFMLSVVECPECPLVPILEVPKAELSVGCRLYFEYLIMES